VLLVVSEGSELGNDPAKEKKRTEKNRTEQRRKIGGQRMG
jgi:hypothetical protein